MNNKTYKHLMALNTVGLALFGVFVCSAVLTPELTTGAATCSSTKAETCSTEVNVHVNPTITVSPSGSDLDNGKLHMEIDRANNETIAFGTVDVKVTTNDPSGYSLYVTTNSDNNNLSNGTVNRVVQPLASTNVAVAAFPSDNRWGYSTNYDSAAETGTFNPVAVKGDTTTAAHTRASATSASGETTSVTIGAKVNGELPSGTYSNTVLFTAVPAMNAETTGGAN